MYVVKQTIYICLRVSLQGVMSTNTTHSGGIIQVAVPPVPNSPRSSVRIRIPDVDVSARICWADHYIIASPLTLSQKAKPVKETKKTNNTAVDDDDSD